jgi:hypothetical protein
VRIDQCRIDARSAEHGGGRRAGKPASNDGNVHMHHGGVLGVNTSIEAKNLKEP